MLDPRTGKRREIDRALPDVSKARDAFAWLQAELERVRAGAFEPATPTAPRFAEYSATVFERKVDLGNIRSAKGREKWRVVLERHLIPAFGDLYIDRIRPPDVKAWQAKVAARIRAGEIAPTTANTILAVLRQVLGEAADDFDIKDPMRGVEPFDTREHRVYTEEEPNSLAPADVPRFLEEMRVRFPQHYAFVLLGFATGLRPSSLRPLRRSGPQADVKWGDGVLLIRRSHTRRDEVMETTKTDLHQRLHLPAELVEVLGAHAAALKGKMHDSELLFPGETGGFRSASVLDKPFVAVSKAIGLPYRFTPRGMRRTYQDLARAAGIHDVVTRAISGHATPAMQRHYSTASSEEVRGALAAVISIATGRPIAA